MVDAKSIDFSEMDFKEGNKLLGRKHYIEDINASQAEEDNAAFCSDAGVAAENAKKKSKQSRNARHFQLTLNEISKWELLAGYLRSLKSLNYLIACKEIAPTTKHEHIHVYVQFSSPVKLSLAKLQGAHVEVCRGSPQQNVAYIKKDGDVIAEEGEMHAAGAKSIADIKKMSAAEREELPAHYYNAVQKINAAENVLLDNFEELSKEVKVFYFYGASGAGKTVAAKRKANECLKEERAKGVNAKGSMLKYEGSFWHGASEDACVALYDDYRDSHMPPSEFINLIDYNIHAMNVKGGSVKNKYKYICITSIQNPKDLYANAKCADEAKHQWLRRMTIYEVLRNDANVLEPVLKEVLYDGPTDFSCKWKENACN